MHHLSEIDKSTSPRSRKRWKHINGAWNHSFTWAHSKFNYRKWGHDV